MPSLLSLKGIAPLVLSCLLLTACGPKEDPGGQKEPDPQVAPQALPGEPGYDSVPVVKPITPLFRVAESGDLEEARKLLEAGADAAASLDDGLSPLHIAAGHGFKELVALLLDHGADLSARQAKGGTPLHLAIGYGRPETAALLLDRGADPFVKDDRGGTPLEAAVRLNDLVTAERLLQMGADINQKNNFGGSPLMIAEREGTPEMVKLLKTPPATGAAESKEQPEDG